MLQSIREWSQGILAWTIILLVSFSFAIWGVHSYIEGSGASHVVATVNGVDITQRQLQTAYERRRQQQQLQLGADFVINPEIEKQLKQEVLQQLIFNEVLSQAAIKQGFRFSLEQLSVAVHSIPAFQVDNQFSPSRFREVLNNASFSEDEFLADLHAAMLINQLRAGLIASSFALPQEIDQAIKLIAQKRDIAYLQISPAQFLKDLNIPPSEIQAYYNLHQEQFKTPEKVSIEYLEVSLPELKKHYHVDLKQLRQYYNDNIGSFTTRARWHIDTLIVRIPKNATSQQITAAQNKISGLAKRVKAGESFTKLARENSEDVVSAKQGGDLGWIEQGTLDPDLEKTTAALKPGESSAPIRTRYGFNLVKLLDSQMATIQPFEKVKNQVELSYVQQKTEQMYADLTEKLANITYANPTSLGPAAQTLGLSIKDTSLFGQKGGEDPMTRQPKILAAAFGNDVLSQNNNSELIELDAQHAIVLRIKQHQPSVLLPIAKVSNEILNQLKENASKQRVTQLAEEIVQQLRKGISGKQLAAQYHLTWEQKNGVGRYDSKINPMILNQAFHLSKGTFITFSLQTGDSVVLEVAGVRGGDRGQMTEKQKRVYQEQIEHNNGQADYERYLSSLFKQAKIKINSPVTQ